MKQSVAGTAHTYLVGGPHIFSPKRRRVQDIKKTALMRRYEGIKVDEGIGFTFKILTKKKIKTYRSTSAIYVNWVSNYCTLYHLQRAVSSFQDFYLFVMWRCSILSVA
jgi:hypothetical protein